MLLTKSPQKNFDPCIVKKRSPKLLVQVTVDVPGIVLQLVWPPTAAPMSGVRKSLTSELTTAVNAAPMTTPIARSTTLPRRMNFLKPSTCPPRSRVHQHAGVHDPEWVYGVLSSREGIRKRTRPLVGVPLPVVTAYRVVMGDRATGREH